MQPPKNPMPEAKVPDLLSGEIARLLMHADRVERREVEALMTRILDGRAAASRMKRPKEVGR
jgi:hypothetical protein